MTTRSTRLRAAATFGIALSLIVLTAPCARSTGSKLERITLAPARATRSVGEAQSFTATGHFADGTTRNLTQRVLYTTSDPKIAAAPNTAGKRSRIEAIAPGTVEIVATDPVSGLSSRDTEGNATLVVVGPLERISLAPAQVTRRVGQSESFTATGHYGGGGRRNLTQKVRYESSDTAVAAVPNAEGNRSRVEILAPGTATISARDPQTGIGSSASGGDATITVVGPLQRLAIVPSTVTLRVGETQSFTVTGFYLGGMTRNLTQEVRYRTSDSAVVSAPNATGGRSKVEAVGVGTATISATDPESGIGTPASHADATVTVLPPPSVTPYP